MILACPSCESKFRVPDNAIGPGGRKVKCKKCAHVWHAMPDDGEDVAESTAAPPPPKPKPAPEPIPEPEPIPDPIEGEAPPPPPADPSGMPDIEEADAGEPPPIPPSEEFVVRQRKPKVEKKSPVMAWIILAVLIVSTVGAGLVFRNDITAAYPPIARIYEWIGLAPNMVGYGLELPDPPAAQALQSDEGLKLIISGEIVSTLGERAPIPLMRGSLIDTAGQELFVWTFRADKDDILPGEAVSYTTEIVNPPEGVTSANITFIEEPQGEMMEEEDG